SLAAFLRAMLYGLPQTRKSDPDENERRKYAPWQGGAYGGTLIFSACGKCYRAERFFGVTSSKDDTFVLYDVMTGMRSTDFSANLGVELFGIDAQAFERSAYLPQKALSGGIDNESLTARLNRVLNSEEENGSYRTAVSVLDKQRQYYKKTGGRGRIAELEEKLAALQLELHEALSAQEEAQRSTERAIEMERLIREARDEVLRLRKQEDALGEARVSRAVLEHGAALLAARDACAASASAKQRFLFPEGVQTADEFVDDRRAAEEDVRVYRRMCDRLDTVQTEQQTRKSALDAINDCFASGIPTENETARLRLLYDVASGRGGDPTLADLPDTLPHQLSESELMRHEEQAQRYQQAVARLEAPSDARGRWEEAYAAAGMPLGAPLPDSETLDAYADTQRQIARVRDQLAVLEPQLASASAAAEAYEASHAHIPPQAEIVSMRSRFDALAQRRAEIASMEESQRAAVAADDAHRRRKRTSILLGGLLLVFAVLLVCLLYLPSAESRYLIAAGILGLPGVILILCGILMHPDADDELHALADTAQKNLCTKKSDYEVERTVVMEFLAELSEGGVLPLEESEAADLFARAAMSAREREILCGRKAELAAQHEALTVEDACLCASLTSYHTDGGGLMREIGVEREALAEYCAQLRVVAEAQRAYDAEQEARALAVKQRDALGIALDRYFGQLEAWEKTISMPPLTVGEGAHTENAASSYTDRIRYWRRRAEWLSVRFEDRSAAESRRRGAGESLEQLLGRIYTEEALSCDGEKIRACLSDSAQNQPISECTAQLRARYLALEAEIAAADGTVAALKARAALLLDRINAYLQRFFGASLPAPEDGLARLAATEAALEADLKQHQGAEEALRAFLEEHRLSELDLSALRETCDDVEARAEEARLAARCGELDAEIAALSERRGHTVRLAEEASAHGAEVASIRQQIEATRSALFEARRRLLAIQRTRDYLDTAKTALSTRYLSVMEARFRYYCGILFRSDPSFARRATLDAELRAQIEVGGVLRRQDYFSRGVRDLLDLCVRLALVDALYTVSDADAGVQEELPPLILDDPFVNLDTAHLRAARALIEEVSGRFQILYCICHESRA
ncbi:MAG: hypothetical protein J6S76_04710, partial [Clostridia bacterium]|nr:hypothetical protein [Clostridia bacterium]